MSERIKVYLAGQSNQQENNWKESFKKLERFDFHDWEFDSDQTSPDTFFPDDMNGIRRANIMIANPGVAPSEGTWIEIGYFYGLHTKKPGNPCNQLIIIWSDNRNPKWSIEFVRKTGIVVTSVEEALDQLEVIAAKI